MKQIIAITAIIAATAATAGGRSTDLPDVSYRMHIPTGVEYKVKGPFLLEGTNIWSVFKIDGRGAAVWQDALGKFSASGWGKRMTPRKLNRLVIAIEVITQCRVDMTRSIIVPITGHLNAELNCN